MNSKRLERISHAHVYFEFHLFDVPLNSWWSDSGTSVHVTNLLHEFVKKRRLNHDEVDLFVGNKENKDQTSWNC